MTDRTIEQLLRQLHATRIEGQLDSLCALFADQASLRIAGTSDGKPIAIAATGIDAIRPWLSMLVKAFRLTGYENLSTVIDGARAAVHWRVDIHSKITGKMVPTELVDLVQVRDARIVSYTEFFVPC
jgi:ketosteroid isomerase-like protein